VTQHDIDRYSAAAHAMQSGVAAEMGKPCEPKHLRVGVNSALVSNGAVVSLLIEKGVFTHDEYQAALADFMEREQAAYEQRLGVKLA
jgi:hypothetical protein